MLEGARVLVTGGTGSLGQVLSRRILSGELGLPESVTVFSRDEAKQHYMRLSYHRIKTATDEVIFERAQDHLRFRIGDVRSRDSLLPVLRDADFVFNAAALKQVPSCEYAPWEAVQTNIQGPENISGLINGLRLPVHTVIGVSTDKAVAPVNVMGMTKAIQERVFTAANLDSNSTRYSMVRYGNVLASRGSVVPLFHEQIRNGGPITITDARMTRFLLTLNDAVDVIFAALKGANPGEIYVPRAPAALITDVAEALIADRNIEIRVTGIRPGEKIHESLVSAEEGRRAFVEGEYIAIAPMLPELMRRTGVTLDNEYTSGGDVMSAVQTRALLYDKGLLDIGAGVEGEELLR